jgi:hyperosmotically inducible periplasmic protein
MRKPLILTMLCLFIAGFVLAQDETKGTYDDLARKVENKIRDKKKAEVDQLKVTNDNGTIYLSGVAKLYGAKWLAENVARKVDGVKDVKNEIALTSSRVDDVDIQGQLINKIRIEMRGTPFDLINVEVHSGFVKLTGNVRDQTLIDDSYQAAIWTPGVRGVENKIEHASIAAGDERLRQLIYGRLNREFPQYFLGKDPSILIIVNSGRVQLIGYVDSNVSVQKIGTIVRSMTGVLSVSNQLQTSH